MKHLLYIVVFIPILALPVFGQVKKAATSEKLQAGDGIVVPILEHRMTPPELKIFLQQRTTSSMMSGTFAGYTSMLWAISEVGVWSEGTGIDNIRLQNPFSENYSPTWKELMDVLAQQVNCSWHYDHKTGYWVFDRKNINPPFTLKIADGWTQRAEGLRVVFVPPNAPVGMDVYTMGHYSSDNPAKLQEVFTNAIKHVSMRFAKNFKSDVSDADLIPKKVCGESALYFSAPTPRDSKLKWRQWAFVKNGWCFIIVSVISDENEQQLLNDVNQMMSTFEATD